MNMRSAFIIRSRTVMAVAQCLTEENPGQWEALVPWHNVK